MAFIKLIIISSHTIYIIFLKIKSVLTQIIPRTGAEHFPSLLLPAPGAGVAMGAGVAPGAGEKVCPKHIIKVDHREDHSLSPLFPNCFLSYRTDIL